MIILTIEEITALHKKLIDRTGGSQGLRDKNLLESAVYSAMSSFEGDEIYSTVEEKAARLMYSLINNHAFIDGNKRIGAFVMLITMQLNNSLIEYSQDELVELSLSVAEGKTEYSKILDWIIKHKI